MVEHRLRDITIRVDFGKWLDPKYPINSDFIDNKIDEVIALINDEIKPKVDKGQWPVEIIKISEYSFDEDEEKDNYRNDFEDGLGDPESREEEVHNKTQMSAFPQACSCRHCQRESQSDMTNWA